MGAGTGIITELFVKADYKHITLLDFSKGMLKKAKKRKSLKGCKFVHQDITKLKLKGKYDVIMSFFSFGMPTYFKEQETQNILKILNKSLKKNGLLIFVGYYEMPKKNPLFKTLKSGKFIPDKKRGYYFDYYVGKKIV
ncbi:ubiquinone/menaquinone biosynthesis methyltransferase [archaeon BMS3Abin17]|nr:ubiquinone/menaquinone biosynthesis methyltransferase [archaeon BMS3Abin17]